MYLIILIDSVIIGLGGCVILLVNNINFRVFSLKFSWAENRSFVQTYFISKILILVIFNKHHLGKPIRLIAFKDKVVGSIPTGRTVLRKICTAADFLACADHSDVLRARKTARGGLRKF